MNEIKSLCLNWSSMVSKMITSSGFLTVYLDTRKKLFLLWGKRLFKYIENFTTKKGKFLDKNSEIFHTSSQNIDCGYSLELPRWGGSYEYPQSMISSKIKSIYPCKSQF